MVANENTDELLLSFLQLMPEALVAQSDGKIIYCNQAAVEYFGASSEDDLLGQETPELVHPDDLDAVIARREKLREGMAVDITLRIRLRRYDGPYFVSDSSSRRVVLGGREIFIGVLRDVTEQVETENKLSETEQNYRSLFEESPDGIYVFDPESLKIVDANLAGAEQLGYALEEIIGKTMDDVSHPHADDGTRSERINRLIAGELLPLRQSNMIKKDGTILPVEVRNNAVNFFGKKYIQTSARDISERLAAEKALFESESRFKDFANSAADRFWETDKEHRHTYLSPPVGAMKTMSKDIVGKVPWKIGSRGMTSHDIEAMKALFEAKRPFRNFKYTGTNRDGDTRHFAINGVPYCDAVGVFSGFRGSTTDETEEFEARNQASLVRQQYFDAIEHLADAVSIYDKNLILMACNSKAKSDFAAIEHLMVPGISFHVIREAFKEHIIMPGPAADNFQAAKSIQEMTEKGHFNDVVQFRDGRWMLTNRYKTIDGGMFVYRIDITEQKSIEESVKKSEARFRDFGNSIADYYWESDQENKFTFFSEGFTTVTGIDQKDILGKSRTEIDFFEDDPELLKEYLASWNAKKSFRNYESLRIKPDGTEVWLSTNGLAIFGDEGEFLGYRGAGRDITKSKLALFEVEKARLEADKANQAKSEFLSSMSHELRTPMNAIMGFCQLLVNNPKSQLTTKQQDFADHILRAGEHLLELIDQVLELSRIESGLMNLLIENISYRDVISQSVAIITSQAKSRMIDIKIEEGDFAAPILRADRSRLRQVIINLLSNAVKYNREGGQIVIKTSFDNARYLRISVIDTGFGIAVSKQGEIFEPFNRLGREAGDIQGTGIGLTITKQIIGFMHCDMGLESEEGRGSTFWVDIPVADQKQLDQSLDKDFEFEVLEESGDSTEGVILYIEDNAANLRLMEAIIDRLPNLTMKYALDGETGIRMAKEVQPNLILMDINLPGIDGIAALSELRKDENTKHIPVIAVSAAAMLHEIERGKLAGFDDYITKPVIISEVIAAIEVHFPN